MRNSRRLRLMGLRDIRSRAGDLCRRLLRNEDEGGEELWAILSRAWDLYRRNFLLFVGVGAVVYVLDPVVRRLAWAQLGGSLAYAPVGVGLLILATAAQGAMIRAGVDRYLDRPATIRSAWRYFLRHSIPYLSTVVLARMLALGQELGDRLRSLILSIVVLARRLTLEGWAPVRDAMSMSTGELALVLPLLGWALLLPAMILLTFWLYFLPVVCVVEGRYYLHAMRRSRQLAAGQWGRIFWVILAVFVLVIAAWALAAGLQRVAMLLVGPSDAVLIRWDLVVRGLIAGGIESLVYPLSHLVAVVLYFDVRVRKEGFNMGSLQPERTDL